MLNKDNFFNHKNPGMMLSPLCPVCRKEYDLRVLEILGETQGQALLYLRCPDCKSACLVTATLGPLGLSLIGMLTDLTREEVIQFKDRPSVTTNDVLNLYEMLERGQRLEKELSASGGKKR